ncbi:hypothetical protein ACFQZ4_40500 [Catellatospora coxensis]
MTTSSRRRSRSRSVPKPADPPRDITIDFRTAAPPEPTTSTDEPIPDATAADETAPAAEPDAAAAEAPVEQADAVEADAETEAEAETEAGNEVDAETDEQVEVAVEAVEVEVEQAVRPEPVLGRLLRRLRSPGSLLVTGVTAIVLFVHAWNITGFPAASDDEGTYLAQAWAVQQGLGLGHYTYWYDHPPLAWIQLAALSWLPAALSDGLAVPTGRYAMLAVTAAILLLTYLLGRRLGCPAGRRRSPCSATGSRRWR